MKSANLKTSPRLQRVYILLKDGKEYSTRQIQQLADVCAVNTAVDELRDPINGSLNIVCQRRGDIWYYRLIRARKAA